MTRLTVDEAVAEFRLLLRAELGTLPPAALGQGGAPPTPEEDEELRFRAAETLLRIACPALCAERRCRRAGLCRHLVDLAARRDGRHRMANSRRTPGAVALRHAIWVCMNGES